MNFRLSIVACTVVLAGMAGAQTPGPESGAALLPNSKTSAVASEASRAADGIETVSFFNKMGYGYGGMVTYNPTPIVLFKSGEALRDMAALQFPGGLAAHKAAHPKDWTKWRRSGKAIEVMGNKGWERIAYTRTHGSTSARFQVFG